MRYWQVSSPDAVQWWPLHTLLDAVGTPRFESAVLQAVQAAVPAASYAIYRTGAHCQPQLFLSGSLGVPDQTHACWQAYCRGLYLNDGTLPPTPPEANAAWLSHLTAQEVPTPHRQSIYDAHALSERLSLHKPLADGGVLALNYYRHQHQAPFSDAHITNFEALAVLLLSLTEKHIALVRPATPAASPLQGAARLQALCPALTPRELEVCQRLLQGLTHEGIAADLGVSTPTVKTYRNRAFQRLGIHFRSQLFALAQAPSTH